MTKRYEQFTAEEKVVYLEAQLASVKDSFVKRFGGYLHHTARLMENAKTFDEAIFAEHQETAVSILANAFLKDCGDRDADAICCDIPYETYNGLRDIIRNHEEEYRNACCKSIGWQKVFEFRFGHGDKQ